MEQRKSGLKKTRSCEIARSEVFINAAVMAVTLMLTVHPSGRCDDGIMLRQLSCTTDKQNVLLSQKFFKIELPKLSLVIAAAAPDWKVISYNTRSKLFCQTPLKDFKASYINNTAQLQLTQLTMLQELPAQKKRRTSAGMDYDEYPLTLIDRDFGAFGKKANGAKLIVLADESMPKAAGEILKKICGFNSIKTDQVPIQLTLSTFDGSSTMFLKTIAASRVSNIKNEGIPKNYRQVAKEFDVVQDKQMQSDIKDLIDNSPMTK